MRALRAIVLLTALALILTFQPAGARTVSKDYVGSFDPLAFGRCADATVPINIGVVCFNVNSASDNEVDISGVDAVLATPGLFYVMVDTAGGCVNAPAPPGACPNSNFVCGSASGIVVPNAAVTLEVYALGVLGVAYCTGLQGGDTVGAATAGTITAKFST
jgi:hypothetical protein